MMLEVLATFAGRGEHEVPADTLLDAIEKRIGTMTIKHDSRPADQIRMMLDHADVQKRTGAEGVVYLIDQFMSGEVV
jgi:hypothetical protein